VSGPGEAARAPIVALVVAMGENRAIGKDGNLPWHLSSDLRYFRKVTLGKPIIMGRRTFESFGRVLDLRLNIILTRDPKYLVEGAVVARSLSEALDVARRAAKDAGIGEIMVIGGEELFREALPLANRIYLTEVDARPEADTWFPAFDRDSWREIWRERPEPGPKDDYDFSFVVLDRKD
jgi:dihydrofolate reductase